MKYPRGFGTEACPFLGMEGDPQTHYGYATGSNRCHRADPPAAVNLPHQDVHCLTQGHPACPVYAPAWEGAFPRELLRERKTPRPAATFRPWIWVAILTAAGALLALLYLGFDPFWEAGIPQASPTGISAAMGALPGDLPLAESATPVPQASSTPTPGATPTALPSQTPTETPVGLPSKTYSATPEKTLPPTPGPLAMTPFGPEKAYILYQVQEGESLTLLANRYGTTTDAIFAAEGAGQDQPLQPGQMILIRLPAEGQEMWTLSLVYVDDDVPVAELSAQYGISEEELHDHNELGFAETIPAGRWLVIPWAERDRALPETPFGPNNAFYLHRVRPGDSIPVLERLYQTSAAVIRAANPIEGSLQVDTILVMIFGETDPANIPPFQVYYLEEGVPVDELAARLGNSEADLIYYNDLEAGEMIPAGRWLIYPQK